MHKIIKHYSSPNFDDRPLDENIDSLIIHYTDMHTAGSALNRLCDRAFSVSSHYLIAKDGTIFNLVDESKRAWHAGKSYWTGKSSLNDNSIGIELDNNGNELFNLIQMKSLIWLCKEIIKVWDINPFNIIGHQDIAPTRKKDPGKYFDWKMLADNGIGILPEGYKAVDNSVINIGELQKKLAHFGYDVEETGFQDIKTLSSLDAFNNHYYKSARQAWDNNTIAILDELIKLKEKYD